MVDSSDAGEVLGSLFLFNHMVIWFQGEVVFAWLSRQMQVKCGGRFDIFIWSFGFKVKSYLHGWVVGCR